MNNYTIYEKGEEEVFKPLQQKAIDSIDSDGKESWTLSRFMSRVGGDT